MKKIIKLFFVIAVIFAFIPKVFAENFYIENYNVDMAVNKNKQVTVTEDLDVFFTYYSHGIMRDIPHSKASVTGVFVAGDQFKTIDKTSQMSIRIGNPDKVIKGKKHYKIQYNYNYHDNKNEFYHNIIGTDWSVPINKVTFKITLPEKIDFDKAGLSIGKKGTKGFNGGAHYTVRGNVITGEMERVLEPYEGITFRTPVPKGYFKKYSDKTSKRAMKFVLFFTILSALIWYKYGKEDKYIAVVNFELPDSVKNAVEAQLYYDEIVTTTGLSALLIELANKGYVKINNKDKSFSIEKLKDYEDESSVEHKFMKALFGSKDKVTKRELKTSETFYQECGSIIGEYGLQTDDILYNKSSVSKFKKFIMNFCVMALIFCMLAFASGFNIDAFRQDEYYTAAVTLLLLIKFVVIDWYTFGLFAAAAVLYLLVVFAATGYTTTEYLPQMLFCIPCIVSAFICMINLQKRTPEANKIHGELQGLKKYIEVTEKHVLELMFEKDPQKFYNILPYAYVFGVSEVWLSKVKDLFEADFDSYNIDTIGEVAAAMSVLAEPSYENGGITESSSDYSSSSGGGGCSGGGGGGGGGSSW